MLDKLLEVKNKPDLYAQSTMRFWDDEHISKGLLEAHLDFGDDAASRTLEFIDKSVDWITQLVPLKEGSRLLDLGCGPGLYCERLYKKGYDVTGIDFSKRSISYAKEMAQNKGHAIDYHYMNYLDIDFDNEFDVVILIYCDFAVLSPQDRRKLLTRVFRALKKDGKLIFDVFTPQRYRNMKEETRDWDISGGGFWKPGTHLCLESHFIYPNGARCNQYVIVDSENNTDIVRVWDQPFTPETIKAELEHISYESISIYSDVTGTPYKEESDTMAMVVQK